MDQDAALAFADRWIALWNSRDLDGVLDLFADHVVFSSPTAARLIEGSDGVVRGKQALRAYWAVAVSVMSWTSSPGRPGRRARTNGAGSRRP